MGTVYLNGRKYDDVYGLVLFDDSVTLLCCGCRYSCGIEKSGKINVKVSGYVENVSRESESKVEVVDEKVKLDGVLSVVRVNGSLNLLSVYCDSDVVISGIVKRGVVAA